MLNILTIDLEDYFQVHAFSDAIKYEDWNNYECRIERNTDRLLNVLSSPLRTPSSELRTPIHATFFVLGWIAERYPDLVRRIQKEGHEIACHGYAHQLVYTQSRDEFRQDVKRAKSILEDITGKQVIGYRAPSYSITSKSQWAFEILMEEGFKYDSSIFPIRHDFYGMPNAPRFPFIISLNENNNFEFSMLNFAFNTTQISKLTTQNSQLEINNSLTYSPNNSASKPQPSVLEVNSLTHSLINLSSDVSAPQHRNTAAHYSIIEFPISTVKIFGQNIPISGGGYFRLFPYPFIKMGLKRINNVEKKPFIFYVHPWELDFEQPRIKEVRLRSRFRHYVNLNKTEFKLKRLLSDFQFSTIRQLLIQNS